MQDKSPKCCLWMIWFFGDVTGLCLIGDVIGCNTFFRFGDVIAVEQVWWLSINLQSNKVIVFGQISQYIIMLMLAEELQPLLTTVIVMPESRWSDYHLLLQHHYHMYIVDNRRYKNLCIIQHILYIISYVQMKHCLQGVAPISLFWENK